MFTFKTLSESSILKPICRRTVLPHAYDVSQTQWECPHDAARAFAVIRTESREFILSSDKLNGTEVDTIRLQFLCCGVGTRQDSLPENYNVVPVQSFWCCSPEPTLAGGGRGGEKI